MDVVIEVHNSLESDVDETDVNQTNKNENSRKRYRSRTFVQKKVVKIP